MADKTWLKPMESLAPGAWDGIWISCLKQVAEKLGCAITKVGVSYDNYTYSTPDGIKVERAKSPE
jgi:SepF-like predicted cell division protein (DUF552 family)